MHLFTIILPFGYLLLFAAAVIEEEHEEVSVEVIPINKFLREEYKV